MAVALAIFSFAFAAFCVWLTVRIVNRQERWAKWTAVALVLSAIVGYPLSIGPAAVFAPDLRVTASDFYRFYYPINLAADECPLVDDFLHWYRDDLWQHRFESIWQECFGGDD